MISGKLKNINYTGISIDTRTLVPGNLYVAIKGDNFDGDHYVDEAFKKGAAGAIVSRDISSVCPMIVVEDTVKTLGEIAKNWRDKFPIPVIGLTGSSGKTTTKNMIKAILETTNQPVLATIGNLNNYIGLPLTLANFHHDHAYAVIEMGMNHFGEIRYLSHLTRPTIALIINAGPCHLEGVGGTVAGVAKAKAEIFEGLTPGGTAIINQDDDFSDYWKNKINKQNKIMTFGIDHPADLRAEIKSINSFVLHYQEQQATIHLKLYGKHNVYNALASSCVGILNNVGLDQIKFALENISTEKGRMQLKHGKNQTIIIDDTYNANPLSLKAAITALESFKNYQKKILVLGDMRELGEQGPALHQECGVFAKENGIDLLLGTGKLTENTIKSFGENAYHFDTKELLIHYFSENPSLLNKDTVVLIKGSRSMQMEKIVYALVEE